jgi:hypothetical protein
VSFLFRSSVAGTFSCSLNLGTSETISCVKTFTVAAANTPTPITLTFPAITASITNGTQLSMGVHIGALNTGTFQTSSLNVWQSGSTFYCASGATNWASLAGATIDVTMLQIEEGPYPSPYQFRSYQDEFAECQRYYRKSSPVGTAAVTTNSSGLVYASTNSTGIFSVNLSFSPPMRTVPTIVTSCTLSGATGVYEDIAAGTTRAADVANVTSSGANILPNVFATVNYGVRLHWSADAEL